MKKMTIYLLYTIKILLRHINNKEIQILQIYKNTMHAVSIFWGALKHELQVLYLFHL